MAREWFGRNICGGARSTCPGPQADRSKKAAFNARRKAARLDPVIHLAEAIFVGVASLAGLPVCIVFSIVGIVPLFHGDHGMIGSGERLFGANLFDPLIDGLLVGVSQLIQIGLAHAVQVNAIREAGQSGWLDFTEN